MAKRFSAERALELIFEESDIDFEEEDEIEHQPKRRRATGPINNQLVKKYGCQRMEKLNGLSWL